MMGDEICRRLREDLKFDGVVVCVSGNAFTDAERIAFTRDRGFSDLVTKGCTPSFYDMIDRIGEMLDDSPDEFVV